jgi:integrase
MGHARVDAIPGDLVSAFMSDNVLVYSFARIGAALGMAVEDVYTQNRRLWVRLREKGGKRHAMPCHHNLDEYLVAYLDGASLRDPPARRGGRDRDQAR